MSDSDNLMSALVCQEDKSCLNNINCKDLNLGLCSVSECDDEYIQMLIQREAGVQKKSNFSLLNSENNWFRCARLDAIKWILNMRSFFGFHFRTAFLSLVYFDGFFSRSSIDEGKLWALRLASVASLSLAAKIEECKAPALSEYHVDDYNFEGTVIQRMEFLILNTLEWKMSSITPFAYLHYFTIKFCGECSHKELETRAIGLVFGVIKEINVVENRPSVIAAAAVLSAHDDQFTKEAFEIKINTVSSLEKEPIFSCCSLMQKIVMLESKTPISVVTQNLLLKPLSSTAVLENSSVPTVGSKRKLTYPDSDQDQTVKKVPQSH